MRRSALALCVGLLVLGMAPEPALVFSVLDQSNTGRGTRVKSRDVCNNSSRLIA
jgi:hypothetical protein